MNVIITGASKGLGKAVAGKFATAGNTLFLCSRNEAQLNETATALKNNYPESIIKTMPVDMSIEKEVTAFGNWVLNETVNTADANPGILINNAGQFIPGSVYNEAPGTLEKMIEVNLYSAYYLTRVLLPKMMEAHQGHIFNMCSIASLKAYVNGGSYSISKFALAGFSQNLREEMKPYNIKVTAVYPGAAYTDSWSGSGVDPQRLMDANDVAEMIYAASRLSFRACVEDIVLRPQLGDL